MFPVAVAVGVSTLAASGCGVAPAKTLDQVSVQKNIIHWLAARYGITPAVSCPSGVPAKRGTTFDCHTVVSGQPIVVMATVEDTVGHFHVSLNRTLIVASEANEALSKTLAGKLASGPVTVTCGMSKVQVVTPGGSFQCTATTKTGGVVRLTATATAPNNQGLISLSIGATVPQPAAASAADTSAPSSGNGSGSNPPAPGTQDGAGTPPTSEVSNTVPPPPPPDTTPPDTTPPDTTPPTVPPTTAPPATDPPTTAVAPPPTTAAPTQTPDTIASGAQDPASSTASATGTDNSPEDTGATAPTTTADIPAATS